MCTDNITGTQVCPEQLLKWMNQGTGEGSCYKAQRTVCGDIMKKSPKLGITVLSEWETILRTNQANPKQSAMNNLRQMLVWRKEMDPRSCMCSQLGYKKKKGNSMTHNMDGTKGQIMKSF